MGYMGWSLKHQSYEKLGEVWILRLPMGSHRTGNFVFFPQNIPYQDPNNIPTNPPKWVQY